MALDRMADAKHHIRAANKYLFWVYNHMPVNESNAKGDSMYIDDMNIADGERQNAMADTNARRGWIADVNLVVKKKDEHPMHEYHPTPIPSLPIEHPSS